MKRVIIIHGTMGSSQSNWIPWLVKELEGAGIETLAPDFPTPSAQSLRNWLSVLKSEVGAVNENDIFVGHSIGAVFLLRMLERIREPIGGSVFVAGLLGVIGIPEYDDLNATFVAEPFDWEQIKKRGGRLACLYGDNDPYVPLDQSEQLARELGVQAQIIEGGGHLNSESGYSTFPLLLEVVTEIVDGQSH